MPLDGVGLFLRRAAAHPVLRGSVLGHAVPGVEFLGLQRLSPAAELAAVLPGAAAGLIDPIQRLRRHAGSDPHNRPAILEA